ncbi:Na(+)-translocating NADH-quinone reductase subunit C [Parashewanella spongiae]|uniref:Na(+)-translocating NADH-quinone reductase subunit C n=1 Tax=Parashewanella spongiae TaxID=342950 RepID=A0A3A6TUU0_9GAMM|nr:Na(+)-translocating NADH-quinone reductase subunit C [Parashewanella spongiae]MCL1078866.1 Na(+)-translocating NADH-quinone reductase subunit C [Parashewanella spongiae]RJY11841.1 Na(+)-translocating NADH-quinone reductase subunit C [Parashewanella spongiae]
MANAANKDSFGRTLFIVVGLCLICSVLVSAAAVILKPTQEQNKLLDKQKYILEAANLINTREGKVSKEKILELYNQRVEAKVVNLASGDFVADIDGNTFEMDKAARDLSVSFKPKNDIASVKRVANNAVIYLVRNEQDQLNTVILPIKGYGLWSTMYAFLAVKPDFNTIENLVYYDFTGSGETPGLGGEVQNPKWIAKWKNKKLYDAQGNLAIKVTKNPVIASSEHGVDALSGATLTSNGVQHSIDFWLGNEGFARFIDKARDGGLN